ncbi:MAG: SDR family NAD(P)-dependent oxidoreductase [Mariprofundaceae bacterium]|nr:SDR family NAD(P)-dependent oxidoreductase [Mariprofundaceae bacterium]
MTYNLKDKVILVTGASDGMGRAVAAALGEEGANVVILGRNEAELTVTQTRIEELGGRCLAIPFDLLKFDDYGKLFLSLKDQIPHLDGLVHCAGSFDRCTPLQYIKADVFRGILDIHLTAPNMLTQIMLPLLRRAEAASIVFTTCDMIDDNQNNWHAYGFAKRALAYVAAMWQGEHPDKPYRFNTLNPGRVRTELFKRAYPGLLPTEVPLAESVTPAYLALLSDDSKDLRGQTFNAADLMADNKTTHSFIQ